MSSRDLISMAVRSLFKRKLRTFLTILGVVIGSASIVVMVSLGVGMNESFNDMIQQMGNITVITVSSEAYYNAAAPKGSPTVDDNSIQSFLRLKGVQAATPVVNGEFQLISGKFLGYANIMGIDMSLFDSLGYKIDDGRLPEPADKNGLVMGRGVVQNFYNPKLRNPWLNPPQLDPYEDNFQLLVTSMQDDRGKYIAKPQNVSVTATMSLESSNAYEVFMDIETVKALNEEKRKVESKYYKDNDMRDPYSGEKTNKGYSQALVKCTDMEAVATVQQEIRDMGFNAWSNAEWLSSMKQTSDSLQGLLGAIGAVSLLVAAIGITNTMLMSIYERTKEIGVMKVIGATLSDIRRLFLVEAALIGFFGGVFGLIVSFGLSYLLNNSSSLSFLSQINWTIQEGTKMSVIPTWLGAFALAFSTVVGVASGYFPARRAMKLSALAAIRAE